ncbi:hypothetical protein GLOTRDRAFT_36480 [Gloeophyllum trabeum ATCC 11539]|uniref:Non-classical export protein 1 n=1 Tax=Gloeophyllum trabeum (strain ATCC 11539 / FP-39264 / Madison 617) TaxID=670483 RepID=S7RTM8_GLOTA|nr:uncharacterized protein GLOTRDRAFT_36480 [Gloeophyllum trabeum ATCC 11539]EPQ58030.1 hypothetical protein GLOTRDRAFT_36480 [Gloeophyllum trabeum ATCC 11539]
MPPVLLSRALDPLLGVFTGLTAYYLYETHPRTAPPPGERLQELAKWKWSRWQQEREERLRANEP